MIIMRCSESRKETSKTKLVHWGISSTKNTSKVVSKAELRKWGEALIPTTIVSNTPEQKKLNILWRKSSTEGMNSTITTIRYCQLEERDKSTKRKKRLKWKKLKEWREGPGSNSTMRANYTRDYRKSSMKDIKRKNSRSGLKLIKENGQWRLKKKSSIEWRSLFQSCKNVTKNWWL